MPSECREPLIAQLPDGITMPQPIWCCLNDGHDGQHFAPLGGVRWSRRVVPVEPVDDKEQR